MYLATGHSHLSHNLTFSGWTQRPGGHPTRHWPQRRRARRLWRYVTAYFAIHTTQHISLLAEPGNRLTQHPSVLVCIYFHYSDSLLNIHTHTFQSISKIPTCVLLISKYHADSEVRGWRQQVCLSDYLHTKGLWHLIDYPKNKMHAWCEGWKHQKVLLFTLTRLFLQSVTTSKQHLILCFIKLTRLLLVKF